MKKLVMLAVLVLGTTCFANGKPVATTKATAKIEKTATPRKKATKAKKVEAVLKTSQAKTVSTKK